MITSGVLGSAVNGVIILICIPASIAKAVSAAQLVDYFRLRN